MKKTFEYRLQIAIAILIILSSGFIGWKIGWAAAQEQEDTASVVIADVPSYPLTPPTHRVDWTLFRLEEDKRLICDWDKKLYFAISAGTGSMLPIIGKDTVLILSEEVDIHVGDMVVYKMRIVGEGLVCHRVIEVKQNSNLICMGLNNSKPDLVAVTPDDIYGVVIGIFW